MTFSYKHFTTDTGVACGLPNVSKSRQSHLRVRVTCPLCQAKADLKPLDDIILEVQADITRMRNFELQLHQLSQPCGPTGDDMFCACGCGGDDSRCSYWIRCAAYNQEVIDAHTCCKVGIS
jgi:hypothetical protein